MFHKSCEEYFNTSFAQKQIISEQECSSFLSSNFAKALSDIFKSTIETHEKDYFLESKANKSITVNASSVISFLRSQHLGSKIVSS